MCGVYFTNRNESAKSDKNFLLRGPDCFNQVESEGIIMCHSLLSLTGEFTKQPIEQSDVKLIFNGQIYNYDNQAYSSDSYFVLNEYLTKDLNFWESLDGEYAVVIHDKKKEVVVFATDIFGTKPLFYCIDNGKISISSLTSTLKMNNHKNIIKCSPNTLYTFNLSTNELTIQSNYFKFKLDQYKTNFDDWNDKFIESIKKRFGELKHEIILPLSSGHDSGAIACAFELLDIKYYSYSILRGEHKKILTSRLIKRLATSPSKSRIRKDLQNANIRDEVLNHIKNNSDPFFYGPAIDSLSINGIEDPGAIGLSYILNKAKKMSNKIKIVASGQGGDEIYSNNQNYTFDKPNPQYFTNNLEDIFPWQNFFYGAQMSYLSKEESIGGSHGLETRYPFLDKELVQEYLSLSPDIKNKFYKSPITNFLKINGYPYRNDEGKSGFNP